MATKTKYNSLRAQGAQLANTFPNPSIYGKFFALDNLRGRTVKQDDELPHRLGRTGYPEVSAPGRVRARGPVRGDARSPSTRRR